MYDDILGEKVDNKKFNLKEEKKEDLELDLFEDLVLEIDDLEEVIEEITLHERFNTTY